MDATTIRHLLEAIAAGDITPAAAAEQLRDLPFFDLGIAKHDAHRPLRNGFSETILCQGKELSEILRIVECAASRKINLLGTRASVQVGEAIACRYPQANFDARSSTFHLVFCPIEPLPGRLAIACAGTADLPVAEEARRTAAFFGVEAQLQYDVGVAGLHRLVHCLDDLRNAQAIIAVAGMEGALPSVIGGLVSAPIIAVPTSVGYGAHFGGIAALLAMLNSCSEGITVVNIDNGFGAACAALRILRQPR